MGRVDGVGRGSLRARGGLRVALGVGPVVALGGALGGALAAGCLDRPIEPVEPRITSTNVQEIGRSGVEKIDLLLVIDNSGSMADKQEILGLAVPRLVERLLFPQCIDERGRPEPGGATVASGPCPDGFEPEFSAVEDINIGIVSSSLGSAGSELCIPGVANSGPDVQDLGRLVAREQPNTEENDVETYRGLGYLAWDPRQTRTCPGTDEPCPGISDPAELIARLTTMVEGVGEVGCGFEAPLEAAYRFLVDPAPWAAVGPGGVASGVDETLLGQRAAFLRPDSLLAVILLSDENDCSIRNDGVGTIVATPEGKLPLMPRPREECAADPDDPCCKSCIEPAGSCPGDGGCAAPGDQQDLANYWPDDVDVEASREQEINLRCFDQKRRFGIDFLYPVERYVNAFGRPRIDRDRLDLATPEGDDAAGEPNPLFAGGRPADQVFVAGIVGVPWQLIARKNEAGDADLLEGWTTPDPESGDEPLQVGGFQTHDEMVRNDVWRLLIPESGADQPDDPHMIESPFPRPGLVADPDRSPDPMHGREYTTHYADLQYACIFGLPPGVDEKDCTGKGSTCDCSNPSNDKPLCDPADPVKQIAAKAYPGTRLLQVLEGLGDQGIPASICARQLDRPDEDDYGYTPAVFAIVDRLKDALGGSCQPLQLRVDDDGNAPCLVIEARDSDGDGDASTDRACTCDAPARRTPEGGAAVAAREVQRELDAQSPSRGLDCLCEVVQLEGDAAQEGTDRHHCQNDAIPPGDVDGWCYIDATSVPPIGNADLIGSCPDSERRLIRFVGDAKVPNGGVQYITCAGESL